MRFDPLNAPELLDGLDREALDLISAMNEYEGERDNLEELCATGAMHPSPDVRCATVGFVERVDFPSLRRDVIEWLLSDADERVTARALQAAFNSPDIAYLPMLMSRLCTTRAQIEVLSSGYNTAIEDAAIACARKLFKNPIPADIEAKLVPPIVNQNEDIAEPPSEMVRIADGHVRSNAQMIYVQEFLIDRFPVTNVQYDQFVEAITDEGHEFCHQDEPPEKNHRRASHQSSVSCDAPVCGIDWYDAYAYAAWSGKALPTEAQWQRAAMGEDGRRFPWGDTLELDGVICAYSVLQKDIDGDLSSEDVFRLLELGYYGPQPVSASQNRSPFGVYGLCGNIWEWTISRFLDGAVLDPRVGTLSYAETQSEWTAHACVKGGSFASTLRSLDSAYRAKKHVMTRSPEVGFRCVVDDRRSGLRVIPPVHM